MQTHLASCLRGPVTQSSACWPRADEELIPSIDDPEVRSDLVRRIRREIAEGIYETPEKLQAALERLQEAHG